MASSSSSSSKGSKAPKSVLEKIVTAIRQLQSPGGSSGQAVQKLLASEYDYNNGVAIKKALKAGVAAGKLVQTKSSYRVAGDAVIEAEEEAKVAIEVIKEGKKSKGAESDSAVVVEEGKGQTVTIAYKGTLVSGFQFDSATSFKFQVGAGNVIKGMDKGVIGMRVGERRLVTIPPKLGYGKRGSSPEIPPNAVLMFDITLKSITLS